MTKAELVDQVATTVDLAKSQTEAVLTQCLQAIRGLLGIRVIWCHRAVRPKKNAFSVSP